MTTHEDNQTRDSDDKPTNIPSVKKMLEDMEGFSALTNLLGVLNPDSKQLTEIRTNIEAIKKETGKFIETIERFNELFLSRGWIPHEKMNIKQAQKAIVEYDSYGIDRAEEVLINQFDEDALETLELFFSVLPSFHARVPLLKLAIQDYTEQRYHACIPVQLLLIDGFVNDLGEGKGFFAEDRNLDVWDSIAGHSKGLKKLKELFCKSRTKTTTEEILIPYRNGILHGRDLGYANKAVAAKLWSAMLAVHEYATAKMTEKTRIAEAPKLRSDMTISEIIASERESASFLKAHSAWRPRLPEQLSKTPKVGSQDEYQEGTAERSLVNFLIAWKDANYGAMSKLTKPRNKQVTDKKRAGEIRSDYDDYKLVDYIIEKVEDSSATLSMISVELAILHNNVTVRRPHTYFLYHCSMNLESVPAGFTGGRWLIDDLVFPMAIYNGSTAFCNNQKRTPL